MANNQLTHTFMAWQFGYQTSIRLITPGSISSQLLESVGFAPHVVSSMQLTMQSFVEIDHYRLPLTHIHQCPSNKLDVKSKNRGDKRLHSRENRSRQGFRMTGHGRYLSLPLRLRSHQDGEMTGRAACQQLQLNVAFSPAAPAHSALHSFRYTISRKAWSRGIACDSDETDCKRPASS